MEKQYTDQEDRLRAQFTSWLTTLLRRARIDYVRQQERQVKTVSIDDVSEEWFAIEDKHPDLQSQFEFEEERLAQAFYSLSIQRQQLLTMLFVEEKKPAEIAEELRCSTGYVALQRYRALQKFRKLLGEEKAK